MFYYFSEGGYSRKALIRGRVLIHEAHLFKGEFLFFFERQIARVEAIVP